MIMIIDVLMGIIVAVILWVVLVVGVATMGLQSCGCAGVAGWIMQIV